MIEFLTTFFAGFFSGDEETPENWGGLSEPTPVQTALLPISLAFGFLLTKAGFLSSLLWYFVTIPTHELGHAVGAWLGSRIAFPIGVFIPMAGFTAMGTERSDSFGALILVGLVLLSRWAIRRKSGALLFVTAILFVLWTRWTFFASPAEWQRFAIWAGIGGEFFLSTTLILLSFYNLPEATHWKFFRIFAVIYGAFGFAASGTRWLAIRAGHEHLPMGSFLAGGADSNGDMEKLIQVYGWTDHRIIGSYLTLAGLCAVLITAHWAYTLSRRLRTSQR